MASSVEVKGLLSSTPPSTKNFCLLFRKYVSCSTWPHCRSRASERSSPPDFTNTGLKAAGEHEVRRASVARDLNVASVFAPSAGGGKQGLKGSLRPFRCLS